MVRRDVGLRPFSPFTIEMANSLNLIKRKYIKMRWVNETFELFDGFSDIQEDLEKKSQQHLFFCSRKFKF